MRKKALRFNDLDNVAVVLDGLQAGDQILVNDQPAAISAGEGVPVGHKIALAAIAAGEPVCKYGHLIGLATEHIPAGGYVHSHNLREPEVQRQELALGGSAKIAAECNLTELPQLSGYRRCNGQLGFRNHLLILSTVVCANQIVQDYGAAHRDAVTITNPSGCIILPEEAAQLRAMLLGLARNPNIGAVIFVGLGCESTEAEWFYEQVQAEKPAAFIRQQSEHSSGQAYAKLETMAADLQQKLAAQRREPASLADVRLGTECGGSDWTTAIVSNPAIGYVSDLVVKNGGISLLGETVGWFGGEAALLKQARNPQVAGDIVSLLDRVYHRARAMGRRIEEGNPSPGNRAGGLSTLAEKALGNVRKGGTAPIEGVLAVAEQPAGKGLYVLDNAGLDPVSLLQLTASSANIILFSTGRGTPVGTPLAPAIKLTGSPEAVACFGVHLDVDLSPVITGGMSMAAAGQALFETMLAVAEGRLTAAERFGHREYAFPLMMGVL
ncbi:MAG: altronate dehydratase family protein [Gracilibacteraceae bacterium]|nr:altronate dehydratase family protein [Gracilibacteraceae bacterium]